MTSAIKLYLLLLYYTTSCCMGHREIILTEDKPYDIIDIKVPRVVFKQALNPTPVLKSPVTIVVPVHVSDSDNELEDDVAADDGVEAEVVQTTVANDIVQDVVSDEPVPVANATEAPVLQDEPTTPTEVTGQVIRFPCSCPDGQCGCCTGAILQRLDMRACGNISFVPEDFVFDVRLTVNNNTVVRRRVSASDPPPICFNPRRAPFIRVCAEISNIRIRNRNAFACLDINADIGGFPVYSASFRCFGLGSSGVQTGLKPKPVSSGPKPVSLFGNSDDDDDRDSFADNVAGGVFNAAVDNGFFGDGGSSDNDDDGGPLDEIGDAIGDFFDGRKL